MVTDTGNTKRKIIHSMTLKTRPLFETGFYYFTGPLYPLPPPLLNKKGFNSRPGFYSSKYGIYSYQGDPLVAKWGLDLRPPVYENNLVVCW